MDKGYVQIYTGDGKGKTTAALGLALRAVGAGMKVFIGQFAKGTSSSELQSMEMLAPGITVRQFGCGSFIEEAPSKEDVEAAQEGLRVAAKALSAGEYEVVILDEACVAVHLGLIDLEQVLSLIKSKPPCIELILTGRNAPVELVEAADLVTEMKDVKHYHRRGIPARLGIEM